MALSAAGGSGPYAPAATVIGVIDGYRKTGFAGQPVTALKLAQIGVSESLIPRTLASLRQLDLIDADGKPTDQFDVLKNAPGDQFTARLAEWLKDTYAPIFGSCDPSTATAEKIEDAFRGYTPEGQRGRMATLFLGLVAYAGILDEAPVKPRGRHATKAGNAPKNGPRKVRIKVKPDGTVERQAPVAPETARQRYLELLIAKAEGQEVPDPELLDRIERALGIAPKEGASP